MIQESFYGGINMSKLFMYFESEEGGMTNFEVKCIKDLRQLRGWWTNDCLEDDIKLIKWMDEADVGEYYEHRLGVIVRLKDY